MFAETCHEVHRIWIVTVSERNKWRNFARYWTSGWDGSALAPNTTFKICSDLACNHLISLASWRTTGFWWTNSFTPNNWRRWYLFELREEESNSTSDFRVNQEPKMLQETLGGREEISKYMGKLVNCEKKLVWAIYQSRRSTVGSWERGNGKTSNFVNFVLFSHTWNMLQRKVKNAIQARQSEVLAKQKQRWQARY